jgi:hypothetical protein
MASNSVKKLKQSRERAQRGDRRKQLHESTDGQAWQRGEGVKLGRHEPEKPEQAASS